MNKTAIVMTKEEAMALPLKERPICFRISSKMYHDTFEAIGSASMCWNPKPSNEVFNSEQASDVAVKLCFTIAEEVEAAKLQAFKDGMTAAANIVGNDFECPIQNQAGPIERAILDARDAKESL